MKSPITKVLLYVLGSVTAVVCAIAFILFVVFGVSLARTHYDTLLKSAVSPDGKWIVKIYDHSAGGDIVPSVYISIESAAPTRFFRQGERLSSVIYSVHNGCALDRAFDARWTSANVLTITYPECSSGPYRSPGDDAVIIKATKWRSITIDYMVTKSD